MFNIKVESIRLQASAAMLIAYLELQGWLHVRGSAAEWLPRPGHKGLPNCRYLVSLTSDSKAQRSFGDVTKYTRGRDWGTEISATPQDWLVGWMEISM